METNILAKYRSKQISKTLATRLKDMLPDLISSNQKTHVKNIYISENGGLIYEVLETVFSVRKDF